MKCPNCEYKDGWEWVDADNDKPGNYVEIRGEVGGFYSSPIEVTRAQNYYPDERASVHACPSCGSLFIGVD